MKITETDANIVIQPFTIRDRIFIAFLILFFSSLVVGAGVWIAATDALLMPRAIGIISSGSIIILNVCYFYYIRTVFYATIDKFQKTISFDERSFGGFRKSIETLPVDAIDTISVRLSWEPQEAGPDWFYFIVTLVLHDGRVKRIGDRVPISNISQVQMIGHALGKEPLLFASDGAKKMLIKRNKSFQDFFN